MKSDKRVYAARMLGRYLKAVSRAHNLPWTYENELDMESLIDLICDAVKDELRQESDLAAQPAEGPHCANCGNLLEPDERHPSKIYTGVICDSCYAQERGS